MSTKIRQDILSNKIIKKISKKMFIISLKYLIKYLNHKENQLIKLSEN